MSLEISGVPGVAGTGPALTLKLIQLLISVSSSRQDGGGNINNHKDLGQLAAISLVPALQISKMSRKLRLLLIFLHCCLLSELSSRHVPVEREGGGAQLSRLASAAPV